MQWSKQKVSWFWNQNDQPVGRFGQVMVCTTTTLVTTTTCTICSRYRCFISWTNRQLASLKTCATNACVLRLLLHTSCYTIPTHSASQPASQRIIIKSNKKCKLIFFFSVVIAKYLISFDFIRLCEFLCRRRI